MGEKRQFDLRPCGASIAANLWKSGFSIKCGVRKSTAIVYPSHEGEATWDEVKEFITEFCGSCEKRRLAKAPEEVGPRV